jgi:hypothetical protein
MGKGSGACSRQPLEMETGVNHIASEADASQAYSKTGLSPVSAETDYLENLNLRPKQSNLYNDLKWVSADDQVSFHKNPEGWYARPLNNHLNAALAEVGLSSQDPLVIFPSLKEVRGAVADAALYSDLNLSPKLKRPDSSCYQIGDLPLEVYRWANSWQVAQMYLPQLPIEIAGYFANSVPEFGEALTKTPVFNTDYPTRTKAVLEVKEWLQEYIKAWLAKNTPSS